MDARACEACVHWVALRGAEGCTASEMFDGAERELALASPSSGAGEGGQPLVLDAWSDAHTRHTLWRSVSRRPEVIILNEPSAPEPMLEADWSSVRLKCAPSRQEAAYTDGRVSLLYQLSPQHKVILAHLARAGRAGVLNKELHEVLGIKANALFPHVRSLEKLGLITRQSVKVLASRAGASAVKEEAGATQPAFPAGRNSGGGHTFVIFLSQFAPRQGLKTKRVVTRGEAERDEGSALLRQKAHIKKVLTLLSAAPGNTLLSSQLRQLLGETKPQWGETVRLMAAGGLVEECVTIAGERQVVECLQLAPSARGGGVKIDEDDRKVVDEVRDEGKGCYVESFPMRDMLSLIESSGDVGVKGKELEAQCMIHSKGFNRILAPLERGHGVSKVKYSSGREVGYSYFAHNAVEGSAAEMATSMQFTQDSLRRQAILSQIVVERGYAIKSFLFIRTCLPDSADLWLFKDAKSLDRTVNALEASGAFRTMTVAIRRKQRLDVREYVMIVPAATKEVSGDLLTRAQADMDLVANISAKPVGKRVDNVAHIETQAVVMKAEGDKAEGIPATDTIKSAAAPREIVPALLGLHGMIQGNTARAKAVHNYLWALAQGKTRMEAAGEGQSPILGKDFHVNINEAMKSMPLETFVRIVGTKVLLESMVGLGETLGEMDPAVYQLLFDERAELRFSSIIQALKAMALLEERFNVEENACVLTLAERAVVMVSEGTEISFDGVTESIEENGGSGRTIHLPLQLDRQRETFWSFLESIFSGSKSTHLFPASKVPAICHRRSWLVKPTSDASLNLGNRFRIIREIADNHQVHMHASKQHHFDEAACRALATSYGIGYDIAADLVGHWIRAYLSAGAKEEGREEQWVDAPNVGRVIILDDVKVRFVSERERGTRASNVKDRKAKVMQEHLSGFETKQKLATHPGVDFTTLEEDIAAIRGFAVLKLTTRSERMKWHDAPFVPPALLPRMQNRFRTLRRKRAVREALEGIISLCKSVGEDVGEIRAEITEGGLGELEQAWERPAELTKLCTDHDILDNVLQIQGPSFSKSWWDHVLTAISAVEANFHTNKARVRVKRKPREATAPREEAAEPPRKKQKQRLKAPPGPRKPTQRYPESTGVRRCTCEDAGLEDAIKGYCASATHYPGQEVLLAAVLQRFTAQHVGQAVAALATLGVLVECKASPLGFAPSDKFHAMVSGRSASRKVVSALTLGCSEADSRGMRVDSAFSIKQPSSALGMLSMLGMVARGEASLQSLPQTEVGNDVNLSGEGARCGLLLVPSPQGEGARDAVPRPAPQGALEAMLRDQSPPGISYDDVGDAEETLANVEALLRKFADVGCTAAAVEDMLAKAGYAFSGERTLILLTELVRQAKAVTVHSLQETFYVHAACAGKYLCGGIGEKGQEDRLVTHRPWLTLVGDVNIKLAQALADEVMLVVSRFPGIKADQIALHLDFLGPGHVAEFVRAMTACGLVKERQSPSLGVVPKVAEGCVLSLEGVASVCRHYFPPDI